MTVGEVSAETLGDVPTERLEAEITEYAAHFAAAECRWLLLVAEYDRRRAYESWGCISCAYWLSWHCGLDLRSARDRVRVARSLEHLPHVREAFAAGRISYSKARAITRIASPATEKDLVMMAEHAPTGHVERIVRGFRRAIDLEEERRGVRDRNAATSVVWFWDDDGSGVVYARLNPEDAATVRKALDAAREDVVAGSDGSAEPLAAGPSKAQALVAMAESYVANGPAARSARWQMVIHVDHDVLTNNSDGLCELDDGPALSPDTARRLACDQALIPVLKDSLGRPAHVGTTIEVPERVKRAVRTRDRGCRFPGCGQRMFTSIHHVRWRSRGGPHKLDNLVELCWHHHWLVHEGGWNLVVETSGALTAIQPNGEPLVQRAVEIDPNDGGIVRRNHDAGVRITSDTMIPNWYGDRLDLDHITSSLMQDWVREHPPPDA
jgi:hypothetical protein